MNYKPMLAQNVDPKLLVAFAEKPSTVYQQKIDGVRVMVVIENGKLQFLNRRGEHSFIDIPTSSEKELQRLGIDVALDGELVDGVLWLFDIASSKAGFLDRYNTLVELFKIWKPSTKAIKLLPIARTRTQKLKLAQTVLANNGEGIIIREKDATYRHGARTSVLQKAKFYKDADFVATELKHGGKDNIAIGLFDDRGEMIDMGEVTALAADGAKVKVGDVITVRYLYVTKNNRVYQPNLPRIRTDKKRNECTLNQLKFVDKRVLAKW